MNGLPYNKETMPILMGLVEGCPTQESDVAEFRSKGHLQYHYKDKGLKQTTNKVSKRIKINKTAEIKTEDELREIESKFKERGFNAAIGDGEGAKTKKQRKKKTGAEGGDAQSSTGEPDKPKTAVQHKMQYIRDAGKLQIRVNNALDKGVLTKNYLEKDPAYASAYKKKADRKIQDLEVAKTRLLKAVSAAHEALKKCSKQ